MNQTSDASLAGRVPAGTPEALDGRGAYSANSPSRLLTPRRAATRIIALGSAPLMDGFRLAGVEVVPNAGTDELEALLKSLVSNKEKALVLIESGLADEPGPWLQRVRAEGGRIVVVQVPSLAGAGEFHSDVDRLIGLSGGAA